MSTRTLRLKREALTEIGTASLAVVGGGGPPDTLDGTLLNTCFSCLPYISCNPAACIVRDAVQCVTTLAVPHDTSVAC